MQTYSIMRRMNNTPKGLRLHIGIFGRTNVGKSSFLNMLSGQQVSITSEMAELQKTIRSWDSAHPDTQIDHHDNVHARYDELGGYQLEPKAKWLVAEDIAPNMIGQSVYPMMAPADPAADLGVARGIEFNCVMTVIDLVPSHVPYNYGYPFLEIFTRWIPRAAWPDKVYPGLEAVFPLLLLGGLSDVWVPTSKEPLLMGPAFTFVGHYWAMGGPLALVLAGLLTGVMFRMIRTLYERNPGSEGDVILYANLIIIGFTEAAATPFVWIYSLPLTMLPVVVLLRFCRRTSGQQDTSRQRISCKGAARVGTRSSVPGTASKRQGATPQGAR